MSMTTKRFDAARAHALCVRLETLRRDYLDLSEELRSKLDEEFEPENQFLNLLNKLEITTSDIAVIAEEAKASVPTMDCCSLPAIS